MNAINISDVLHAIPFVHMDGVFVNLTFRKEDMVARLSKEDDQPLTPHIRVPSVPDANGYCRALTRQTFKNYDAAREWIHKHKLNTIPLTDNVVSFRGGNRH